MFSHEVPGWGRMHTVDIYIDGKPSDIPIYASIMWMWGYVLQVEWFEPGRPMKHSRMYFNYRCVFDGVPIKKVDFDALKKEKPTHHKLEMFTGAPHCRVEVS